MCHLEAVVTPCVPWWHTILYAYHAAVIMEQVPV